MCYQDMKEPVAAASCLIICCHLCICINRHKWLHNMLDASQMQAAVIKSHHWQNCATVKRQSRICMYISAAMAIIQRMLAFLDNLNGIHGPKLP